MKCFWGIMISVCIAVYNGENFLEAQVNSILPQLSAEDEIVVSDDCSTDSSLSILKAGAMRAYGSSEIRKRLRPYLTMQERASAPPAEI